MNRIRSALLAAFVVLVFAAAPMRAEAQDQMPATSFDAYRAGALTAGLMLGSAAAVIVTDGLILPVVSYATGGPLAYGGGGYTLIGNTVVWVGEPVYQLARAVASIYGAVSGIMWADSWYHAQ